MVVAFIFSGLLLVLALYSIYWQIENLKGLRKPHIPSDDRRYRRNQAVFRLANGVLLLCLSAMIAGAFLSGMEQRATELGERHEGLQQGQERPEVTDADRDFLRIYSWYWISFLIGLFAVVSIAIVDLWATRGTDGHSFGECKPNIAPFWSVIWPSIASNNSTTV